MIDEQDWQLIRKYFGHASHVTASPRRGVPYCAISTVNEDGSPHVTPVSSMILREDVSGFYLEEFSAHMSRNIEHDKRVCVLLVNNNLWFWKKAVFLGRFNTPPAIRLTGTVGQKRPAAPEEIKAYRRPISPLKIFRGYNLLWGKMKVGRDISFDSFEHVQCGPMKYLATF